MATYFDISKKLGGLLSCEEGKAIYMNKSIGMAFRIPPVVFIAEDQTQELLSMDAALSAVEQAFRLEAEGKAIMPRKLYLDLPQYHGDFQAMPAYVNGIVGLKWVSQCRLL